MAEDNRPVNYIPCPIDTSHVSLPVELLCLVERLAENAHDICTAGRIAEGWSWGPNRSDIHLHHPCLVPYLTLPNTEKDYDRSSVTSTLKVLIALGYKIVKDTEYTD